MAQVIHLGESFYFWFWFISIHNSFWFLYILICDSILFYPFWFGLILIRRESRFTRESWFICETKIKGKRIVIHSFANHELIRFRYKSESKWIANQAGPSPDEWYTYVGFLKFPVEKYKKSIWCGAQTQLLRNEPQAKKIDLLWQNNKSGSHP